MGPIAEAGTVWVSVVPSMRGFGARVRSELAGLRDLEVNVRPQVDTRDVRRELDNATRARNALVRIDADISDSKRKIAETRTQLDNLARMNPSPEVDAVTDRARQELARLRAQLAELERKRPEVKVDADTAGATEKVTRWTRFMSGAKVAVNLDVDTALALAKVRAFTATASKMSIGSLGTASAIQGVMGLTAALAPAVGILATLPAAAGAGGLAVGTLKTAFSGFGDAIGDDPKKAAEAMAKMAPAAQEAARAVVGLKPAWQGLQLDVQGRFFDGLATRISGLGRTYIPILRGAMAGLAADINGKVKDAFDTLSESGNVTGITVGLGFVRQGLASMFGALAPLTQAFTTLFVHGAPYIAQFGAWVHRGAGAFSLFIANAARAGQIEVWINDAIWTFKQLGGIVANVGSIVGSVFGAMQATGGGVLGTLRMLTGELAASLRAPAGAEGLRTFFSNVQATVQAMMPGLRALGSAVLAVIQNVAPALPSVGFAFSMVAKSVAPFIEALSWLVGAILPPLMYALGFLSPALVPIAIGVGILVGVLKAWFAVQLFLNSALWAMAAALLANPITWVIAAILALIGVVIYAWNNWTWFREAVTAAWQGIVAAAVWAWTNILQPMFAALGIAVMAVGAFFTWLWQAVIVPAWNAIGMAVSFVWTSILQPIFSFIGTALSYLGLIIGVVLVAPFVIAWNIISAIVMWAWNTILSPIFYGAILPALTVLGAMFTWLWQAVIVPVWQGITIAIQVAWAVVSAIFNMVIGFIVGVFAATWRFLWTGVIVPVWNGITSAISAAWGFISGIFNAVVGFLRGVLGPVFTWLWQNIIIPVWNGIVAAIRGAWDFIQGVFNVGKAAVNAVGQAFQFVADWIARAWASIREAARGPIQFVVDVVYNNGIRPVWNGIASLFGMSQLAPVHMATGGVLPGYTPGRDIIPTMLSGGEGILVPEAVRGLGPAFVGWANRTFSGGRSSGGAGTGYADGGVVGGRRKPQRFAEGGILDGIGGALSGMGDFFMSVFTDPAGAVRKLFGGVLADGGRVPGAGSWTEGLKKLPGKVVEAVIAKVKKWVADIMAMGGMSGNWAPVVAQALAITGQPQHLAWRVLKQIQIESGGNPRAINLWDINAKRGTPSKGLIQTIDPTFQRYRHPGLPNDPYHPLANIVAGIRYAIARYGSIAAIWPKTMGYDRGGIAGGTGYMLKQTIHPERVLSPRQTRAFESLVPMLSSMSRRGAGIGAGVYDGISGAAAGAPAIGTYVQQLPEGTTSRRMMEELTHELRRTGMASGVHGR